MQIKVADTAGFCFGVNRAVDLVYKMVDEGKKVCTLGPIIHNQQVVDDLKSRGVTIAENISEVPEDYVLVVRTHGVPRSVIEEADSRNMKYCNATCPFVTKIHNIVSKHSNENNIIFIAGDEKHPEVQGIRGYANGPSYVFQSAEALENIVKEHPEIAVSEVFTVAQTTFSVKEWENCVKKINLLCTNATIFDTICNATQERQEEAEQLSRTCDAMVIVGGRHSSNTRKLRDVCAAHCPTYLIETSKELPALDFSFCNSVGITAGASTPSSIIKEVLLTMSELVNEQTDVIETEESFEAMMEASLKNLSTDQKVRGVVVGIAPNEIQVDIGRKHAGYIPLDEFSGDPTVNPLETVKVGDEMDLIIMKTNDAEGTVMLSKRRFDAIQAWDDVMKAAEDESVLEGVVTDVIRGGVLASTNGVRVFIPASLATASRNEPLEGLLKQHVKFRIIEVNKQRRRAVGSIRAVLKEARKAAEDAFWAQAEEGQVYTGTVKSMTSYGAFVDIGGVDGMIHISELSWSRVKHPSEVVSIGDTVEVYIKSLDAEKKKISLGYKKVEDNPWEVLRRDYPVDSVIDAQIVGLTTFGAFARIIPGVDGLIHISQLADHRVEKPQDVVTVGDTVKVKITEIDFDKKRVSLSIRALIEPAAEEEAADEE